ncbi:MAG: hypothetical protein WBC91_03185 [Phototrophicaceae bacterium]
MEKQTNSQNINMMSTLALAVGVGTANAVALNDPAVGFGISIAIFGTVIAVNKFKNNRQQGA